MTKLTESTVKNLIVVNLVATIATITCCIYVASIYNRNLQYVVDQLHEMESKVERLEKQK